MSITHYIPNQNSTLKPILLLVDGKGECFDFLANNKRNLTSLLVDALNFDDKNQQDFENGIVTALRDFRESDGETAFFGRKRIAIIHDTLGYCDPTQDNYNEGVRTCFEVNKILERHGFDVIGIQAPNDGCSLAFKKLVEQYLD